MGAFCSRTADILPPDGTVVTGGTSNQPNPNDSTGGSHPLANLRFGSSSTTKTAPRRESEKRGMR
jgi:hypothetical protein